MFRYQKGENMKKLILIFLMSIGFAASAATVDTSASTVKWTGYKFNKAYSHAGTIPITEASLKTKKDKVVGGNIVLNMAALNVTDIPPGKKNKKLEGHLRNADFFDVETHPTAAIEITGMKNGVAKGKLTIKGITKKVSDIKYTEADGVFKGAMSFNRAEFGVIYKSKNPPKSILKKLQVKAQEIADKNAIEDVVDIEFIIATTKQVSL